MLEIIKAAFTDFMDDDAPRLAAALSYYTVFSLPPLLILLVMIAGFFVEPENVQGRLVGETGGAIGPEGAEQIRTMLEQAKRPGGSGPLMTILSIAALIFGATGVLGQLKAALNKAWNVEKAPEKSGLLKLLLRRVLSLGMILVIAFLLLVSMVISTLLSTAGGTVAELLPGGIAPALLWVMNIALSLLVIGLLFMAMYKILPDADVAWSDVWRGALATAALFVLGNFLLSFYFSRSDPGSAFGAAGSLALLLVWVYYSAMIFFFGAELTQAYAQRRGHGIRPDEDAVRTS